MYSNCLFEAIKAKIKDPKTVQIIYLKGGLFGKKAHFMWRNGCEIFHAYNPKGSSNIFIYKVSYKNISFDSFEAYVLDAIKKLPFEKQIIYAKKLHLKSIEIPGVLNWTNLIKDSDPDFSNVPKKEDFYYLTKILRSEPLIKVLINRKIKTLTFDELISCEKIIQWKYVTPFDNDYTTINGWNRNREIFKEIQ